MTLHGLQFLSHFFFHGLVNLSSQLKSSAIFSKYNILPWSFCLFYFSPLYLYISAYSQINFVQIVTINIQSFYMLPLHLSVSQNILWLTQPVYKLFAGVISFIHCIKIRQNKEVFNSTFQHYAIIQDKKWWMSYHLSLRRNVEKQNAVNLVTVWDRDLNAL